MKKIVKIMSFALLGACFLFLSANGVKAADETIKNGISIEGLDVSGMSKSEAQEALNDYLIKVGQSVITLKGSSGNSVDVKASDLGLECVNPDIVEDALLVGEKGNVVSRYKQKKDLEQKGLVLDLVFTVDRMKIENALIEKCSSFDQHAKEASLVRENGAFTVIEGVDGFVIDIASSKDLVADTLEKDWDLGDISIELIGQVEKPKRSTEDFEKVKDLLGTFSTSYASSAAARSANISNGCEKINGTILYPGEEFSTYETVKPFSADNGYQMAGSYLNGMVVDSMGGGICQVSTTLYNAVLLSELEVTERNNHSMVVTYVPVSADAAISESAGKDFRFKNNTEYPIYIEGITENKKITFNIYGCETRDSNRTVSYENEILQVIQPDYEKIIADASQGIGYVKVQGVHVGYKARLWKIVKVDGEEVERVQVNTSNYAMSPRTAVVGIATANPDFQNEILAAIGTGSIDHVKGVAAALYAQEVAAAAGQ